MSDLYEILGVPRDATPSQIKKGYHSMAMKYHPDKQTEVNVETSQKFLAIVDAYTVLSNESLRNAYDKELELKEATNSFKQEISTKRKDMIDELNIRESEHQRGDPLQVYRDELKKELKAFAPKTNSHTFEEYEHIIISSLLSR